MVCDTPLENAQIAPNNPRMPRRLTGTRKFPGNDETLEASNASKSRRTSTVGDLEKEVGYLDAMRGRETLGKESPLLFLQMYHAWTLLVKRANPSLHENTE